MKRTISGGGVFFGMFCSLVFLTAHLRLRNQEGGSEFP